MVAVREDLGAEWDWDDFTPTHSETALTYDKWVEPVYWEQHGLPEPERPATSPTRQYTGSRSRATQPGRWQTVRDMLRTPGRLP